ncbi:MAG: metal ABC transporter permease [Methanomassiliicoccales archaeon]
MVDIGGLFEYTFFQRAFFAGICAAILCSALGVFIVLKRASLIGEGIAHLSFGGIALGLVLAVYPLYTALILALLGTSIIFMLGRSRIIYSETAIGLMFSAGLAMGAVLATLGSGLSVDLFSYLFGSILTVSSQDILIIAALTAISLLFIGIFYKELMLMTFDEISAKISGVPITVFEMAFNVLVALTVVASIKIVGALLVSALIITPAASAMQLSKSFKGTMISAIIIGIATVQIGLLTSFYYDLATGGAIVLIGLLVFVICVALRKILRLRRKESAPDIVCTHGFQSSRIIEEEKKK